MPVLVTPGYSLSQEQKRSMEEAKVLLLQVCTCSRSSHFPARVKRQLTVGARLLPRLQNLTFKGDGLEALTVKKLGSGLQISDHNQIVGLEPRTNLLRTLGTSLKALPEIFGDEGRPGNLLGKLQ